MGCVVWLAPILWDVWTVEFNLEAGCGEEGSDWGGSSVGGGTATADFKVNQAVMKAVSHDPSVESIHLGHGEAGGLARLGMGI